MGRANGGARLLGELTMTNILVKSLAVAALATSAFGSVALAASTDPSRSDSVFVRSPDHSNVPPGKHHPGDTADARSASRSDAAFVRSPDHSKVPNGAHYNGQGPTERSSSRSDSAGWH
jgi:hypothetical protein